MCPPTDFRATRHQLLRKEIAELEQELDEQISNADPYERISYNLHIEVSLLEIDRQRLGEDYSELRKLIVFVQEVLTDARVAHSQWRAAMNALREELIDLAVRPIGNASNSMAVCELGSVAARMMLENYVEDMDKVAKSLPAIFELRDLVTRSEFSAASKTVHLAMAASNAEVLEETAGQGGKAK